jgi:hypothetical protein
MFKRVTVLAVVAFFAFVGTSQAQTPIEIGADNAIGYSITGELGTLEVPDAFFVSLPMTMWRFGFHVNETWSIEPGLGFTFVSLSDDAGSVWELSPTVNVLYNLPSGLFFNAGAGLDIISVDPGGTADSETTTIFGFGGGVGYRVWVVDRLAIRLAANGLYTLESEDDGVPSSIDIVGLFGFSFYTQ